MCGIAGSTSPDAQSRVEDMLGHLAHRGPDDHGLYVDPAGAITLGARRLSIIDVPGGHQPISNEDGTVWAAHNGEIYNFEQLRGRLLASGHSFSSRCDTEVLVHLYERYGADLVHAIEGMFAFAIWDQSEQRLLLARDRSGEKPLFVYAANGGICFASELGALLAAGAVSHAALDPAIVDGFYVLGYVPPSAAFVAGVMQLAPGSLLEWRPGGQPSVRAYWSPPAPPARADSRKRSELVAEADELLVRAVESRLVSDVPLGLFLSGGLDSTLVAAIARERHELRTFSVGYDVGDVDETAPAAEVAARLETQHEQVLLAGPEVAELAPRVLAELDQPLADQSLLPMYALSRAARRSVTVIVGGEGADEYFAGYPRYRWLERAQRLTQMGGRAALALAARAWPATERRERLGSVAAAAPAAQKSLSWVTSGRDAARAELYGERMRELALAPGVATRASEFEAELDVASAAMSLDRRLWLPGDVLTKADRAGMLNSLEIRTPFLERALMEFACSVSFEVHSAHRGKALLKEAFRRRVPGFAPPAKRGFIAPAAEWLRGPLAEYLGHCCGEGRVVADGWFRREPLVDRMDEHMSGGADHSAALWPVLALNAWLEGPHGSHAR
jgi:asparagine synthase (glutamine-hydrolysing)